MFERILGQPTAIGTLRRALETGRIHHAYRFEGPSGVGKEMAAFEMARALVCATPPPEGLAFDACGRCSACSRAATFADEPPRVPLHPDVVVLERGLYAPEILRRARPESQEISVDQIRRLVLERAGFGPHEGKSRVFIVRRAHELSTSAANALLKTLEEPPNATYFVLITDRGSELVSTIQSRSQLVRFAPLSSEILKTILAERGIASPEAEGAVELAGGSAEYALSLADPEASSERNEFVRTALSAIAAPNLAEALAFADARERDKHKLLELVAALAAHMAREGRRLVAQAPDQANTAACRHAIVTRAAHELERNGAPALVLEAMMTRLRARL